MQTRTESMLAILLPGLALWAATHVWAWYAISYTVSLLE